MVLITNGIYPMPIPSPCPIETVCPILSAEVLANVGAELWASLAKSSVKTVASWLGAGHGNVSKSRIDEVRVNAGIGV